MASMKIKRRTKFQAIPVKRSSSVFSSTNSKVPALPIANRTGGKEVMNTVTP